MKRTIIIILSIIVIGLFIWFYISNANFTPENQVFLEKINKLELKIDSLKNQRDSVRTIIDSTHVKIITNEKHYQERINVIITQSSSADSSFVADYIRQYTDKDTLLNSK